MAQPEKGSSSAKPTRKAWDLQARTGTVEEIRLDQSERRITFRGYAERWRHSRKVSQRWTINDTSIPGYATTTIRTSVADPSEPSTSQTFSNG
jgi:hypothetical protein